MTVLLSDGRKDLREALRQVVEAFSAGTDWSRGVLLKPNIVFPVRPKGGEITSPDLVRTLVAVLRERLGDLDIVLGEGVAAGYDAEENFRVSGFAELARELRIPIVDLDKAERTPVDWKLGTLKLPSMALDRIYLNLPILKYSSACVVSGALKNQKGLLLPAVKKRFHLLGLHEQIADLNAVVKPDFTILDCSRFFGPNVLLSGDNCGEIDATACDALGIEEPEYVRCARLSGVFGADFTVMGDLSRLKPIAARPEARESRTAGRLRLWSNARACTGCRALFGEMRHDLLKPGNLRGKSRLITHAIRGAEIVMGPDPEWRQERKTVICVGICTRRLAKESGYVYVPGCPPSLADLYEHLGDSD